LNAKDRLASWRSTELSLGDVAKHPWSIADACEGTQIFGSTGSGKTTGSGRALALGFLRAKFGGLVLTAKPDERTNWQHYFEEAKRDPKDLVIVDLDSDWNFNFLDYEHSHLGRGRRLTQNLVSLFSTVIQTGDSARSGSDPYWEYAFRQLLTNAIDTIALSQKPITLQAIVDVILTAPRSLPTTSDMFAQSACAQALRDAWRGKLGEDDGEDLRQCLAYWESDFAALAERTRSIIVSSFTSRATSLLRGPVRRIFCSSRGKQFAPENSHAGKVILLDFPVKELGDVGRFAQLLFKTMWQRATERRIDMRETLPASDGSTRPNKDFNPDFRPVFLWADESQHFITEEDMLFQATARTSLAATVYLTQNITSYYASVGGRDPRATTESLLGNLQTKIFHANGDPTTNEWAERVFGKRPVDFSTRQVDLTGGHNSGAQESRDWCVPARDFTLLKKGGEKNGGLVEAVVFHAGRNWNGAAGADGENVLRATFNQGIA